MADANYKEKARGESEATFNKRLRALVKVFKVAADNLDNELKTLDDNGEKVFLKTFLNELKNAVTAGEGLIFVEFNPKGTYDYLNPHTLNDLVTYVDLEAKLVLKTTPYLYIFDSNSGKNVAHIRLEVQGSGRLILKYELDELIPLARDAYKQRISTAKPQVPAAAPAPAAPANPPAPVAGPQPAAPAPAAPASIQNQTKTLANSKIPMGSQPT
jgi:hypothetical protein